MPLPLSAEPLTATGARVLLSCCWAGAAPRAARPPLQAAAVVLERSLPRAVIVPSWAVSEVWAGVDADARERAWRRLASGLAGVVVVPDPDMVLGAGDLAAVSALNVRGRPALVLLGAPQRPVLAPVSRFRVERLAGAQPWRFARLARRSAGQAPAP